MNIFLLLVMWMIILFLIFTTPHPTLYKEEIVKAEEKCETFDGLEKLKKITDRLEVTCNDGIQITIVLDEKGEKE